MKCRLTREWGLESFDQLIPRSSETLQPWFDISWDDLVSLAFIKASYETSAACLALQEYSRESLIFDAGQILCRKRVGSARCKLQSIRISSR